MVVDVVDLLGVEGIVLAGAGSADDATVVLLLFRLFLWAAATVADRALWGVWGELSLGKVVADRALLAGFVAEGPGTSGFVGDDGDAALVAASPMNRLR